MDQEWTLVPKDGLTQLKFGMLVSDVAKLSEIYGAVEAASTNPITPGVADDNDDFLSKYFSDDELAKDKDHVDESTDEATVITQRLTGSSLVLDYLNGRLQSIIASEQADQINLSGERIFQMESDKLLRLLESANGSPGRYDSTGAAFDNIALYLDGFTETNSDGKIIILTRSDDRFESRTITARHERYQINDFLPEGKIQSFL
ncbi:hypothetical protein ASG39_05780 [Rhizobium sp. Leaf371]|uniref:hypothetical protein n=1 Tax=Rhizobium sp. Leaf371 TaxID=1736355 RepID=UPI000715779F|nr:hypothetical protein [Rhizobium sp. Leaf371]KQS67868.1 hypothetical protein ASG39_05780 [Rhizobium sp. Leaf371]